MHRASIISFAIGLGLLAVEGALQISGYQNLCIGIWLGGFAALCFLFAVWQALHGIGVRGFCHMVLDNFAAWRVREWLSAQDAMSKFAPDFFSTFEKTQVAAQNADAAFQKAKHEADDPFDRSLSADLLKDRVPFAASARTELGDLFNHAKETLSENIRRKLETGSLIAKGLKTPYAHGDQKIVIPRSQWKVLNLDGNRARAKGIEYIEIVIGKRR